MSKLLEIQSMNLISNDEHEEMFLESVDFTIKESKLISLMGDSGSGKSLFAYAIMSKEKEYRIKKDYRLFSFNGIDIRPGYEKNISYVPQEPLSSLNPVIDIFKHFKINDRKTLNKNSLRKQITKLLVEAGFSDIEDLLTKYPHELSGGMAQRVLIALALQSNPNLLIADEATSSLDAVNAKLILDLLLRISKKRRLAVLVITHDPRIALNYCSEHYQIRDRRLVKFDSADEVKKLYKDYQNIIGEEQFLRSVEFHTDDYKIEIVNLNKIFFKFEKSHRWIIKNLNILIHRGEALGLIGLSGSGKSTISKLITRLLNPTSGQIFFEENPINEIKRKKYAEKVQIVFQDLFGSLNPKRLIKDILLDSLEIGDQNKSIDKLERIKKNLLKVGLSSEILGKYPLNLSGGQRQKVLILKAILSEPQFIIFDEPMSSLDIKSQSEIILIIKKLMKSSNLTILFITHDFRLIKNLCDKVVVLSDGQIVETGQTGEVFNHPAHIETKKLLQVVK